MQRDLAAGQGGGALLGVAGFLPFLSERCVARPDAAAIRKRQERWQRIAEEASKQAGRSEIPQVYGLSDWEGVRAACAGRFTILAYEAETKQGLAQVLQGQAPEQVAIVIGPEGGFSPAERTRLRDCGFVVPAGLGPRILRADTAAISALTIWQAAAPDKSLAFLIVGAAPLLLVILAYTSYAYWVFRGKTPADHHGY